MADIQLLADELTNDPLTRGYSGMTDSEAAASLNTVNREGPPSSGALLQYLTLEKFRTGTLYGRIQQVANVTAVLNVAAWVLPQLPLGSNDALVAITQDHVAAANSLLRFVDTDTGFAVSLLDSRITSIIDDLGPSGCQAIGNGDKTAIQALSSNRKSRGEEIGYGHVREGNVLDARAL